MKILIVISALSAFGSGLTGCSKGEAAEKHAPAETRATSTPTQDTLKWANMDHEQRKVYMRETVLPQMRQTFAAFNEEEYGRINCKTCHGDGATDETFKMPNPKLPKLPSTTEGFMELMKKDSASMAFMMHQVKPQMAELLGLTPSDPMKGIEGFGCTNCHTMK